MAPVIWGLNLGDMKWSAFKSSNMFDKSYHRRRTKMLIYQMAMIFCVCSESVGTAALVDYENQQSAIHKADPQATIHNDDFVGIASYNIFVGVTVATIFGAAFFFDLFFPERHESRSVRMAWKISAVAVTVMCLADAVAFTVIVATQKAYVTGVTEEQARELLRAHRTPELDYKHYSYAIASVVLLWVGFVGTVLSCITLITCQIHDDKHGPLSKYGRYMRSEGERKEVVSAGAPVPAGDVNGAPVPLAEPVQSHGRAGTGRTYGGYSGQPQGGV